ncbi:hypothetical protein ABK040_009623 [Willaertia magna]
MSHLIDPFSPVQTLINKINSNEALLNRAKFTGILQYAEIHSDPENIKREEFFTQMRLINNTFEREVSQSLQLPNHETNYLIEINKNKIKKIGGSSILNHFAISTEEEQEERDEGSRVGLGLKERGGRDLAIIQSSEPSNVSNESNMNHSFAVEDDDDGLMDEYDEMQRQYYEQQLNELMRKKRLAIKLLITESYGEIPSKRIFRQVSSPILNLFDKLPSYGMFHVALLIGPWKIEYVNSSFVVISKAMSLNALAAIDIDILQLTDIEQCIEKVSKVIAHWNTTKYYKNTGCCEKEPNAGNCQDFVNSVLEELGLLQKKELVCTGAIKKYLTRLRKKGRGGMKFFMDEEFKVKFNISIAKDYIKFETHKELDQFVIDLQNVDPFFELHYPTEYSLLKAFDRAMWMRNYISKGLDDKYTPLVGQTICYEEDSEEPIETTELQCPFNDPKVTWSTGIQEQPSSSSLYQ